MILTMKNQQLALVIVDKLESLDLSAIKTPDKQKPNLQRHQTSLRQEVILPATHRPREISALLPALSPSPFLEDHQGTPRPDVNRGKSSVEDLYTAADG